MPEPLEWGFTPPTPSSSIAIPQCWWVSNESRRRWQKVLRVCLAHGVFHISEVLGKGMPSLE